jgi:heme-degrading monooxygenase HmoA
VEARDFGFVRNQNIAFRIEQPRTALPDGGNPLRYHGSRVHRMFIVVWQFEVAEEKIAAFEAAYGADGSWAQLFRSSPDYKGTELLRDAYIQGSYLTIDRWASEDAFRAFRKEHDAAYETLDRSCDALTSRETRIGAYTA